MGKNKPTTRLTIYENSLKWKIDTNSVQMAQWNEEKGNKNNFEKRENGR